MAKTNQKKRSKRTSRKERNDSNTTLNSTQAKADDDIWCFKDANIQIIDDFEKLNKKLKHKICNGCRSVSISLDVKKTCKNSNLRFCSVCQKYGFTKDGEHPEWLPTWIDITGQKRFDLPNELDHLREGEKLLIQQVAPYVPIHHLRQGAHGLLGHVCCFPQDIDFVCRELPRKHVNVVRIIKNYKMEDGSAEQIIFKIRRSKVILALKWLKKHNVEYANITINENNLDWMQGKEECCLNVDIQQDQSTANKGTRNPG